MDEIYRLRELIQNAVLCIPHECTTCKYQKRRTVERCSRCIGDSMNWHLDDDNWEWSEEPPREMEVEE